MTQEQALQIIKQVIDSSIKSGLFQNLENTVNVAIAYETLSKAVQSNQPKAAVATEAQEVK